MVEPIKAEKQALYIIAGWLLFSILYLFSAWYKPFHVDEFFSWVYAERSTFGEIILLKDFGIGHPPLYHLIQKLVQQAGTSFTAIQVRFANYLAGSLFVVVLSSLFLRHRRRLLFTIGVCVSATVLDLFLFSRMWGLLCLFSALLLRCGEKYCETGARKYLYAMAFIWLGGILSDYNFVLLLPYTVMVLFARRTGYSRVFKALLLILLTAWLLSKPLYIVLERADLDWRQVNFVHDIADASYAAGTILFNFWFKEPFFLAIGIFAVAVLQSTRRLEQNRLTVRTGLPGGYRNLALAGASALLLLLSLLGYLRLRYTFLAVLLLLLLSRIDVSRISALEPVNLRLSAAIIGGMISLVTISPFAWRDLRDRRFLVVLLPCMLFFLLLNLNRRALRIMSVLLLLSGLIYVCSYRLSDHYPPPYLEGEPPVLFQDVFAYATTYFHGKTEDPPRFFDRSKFRFCSACRMGTDLIPFDRYSRIRVIARSDFDPRPYLPEGFDLQDRAEHLSALDKWQFRYLTPLYADRYAVLEYKKAGPAE